MKSSQVPGLSHQRSAIGGAVALIAERHVLWTDRAQVQVHRRGAGPAVERERHRPVAALDRVGGEHDVGALFPVPAEERQRADRRGVLQRLAVQLNDLVDMGIAGKRRQGLRRMLGGFRLGSRRRRLCGLSARPGRDHARRDT